MMRRRWRDAGEAIREAGASWALRHVEGKLTQSQEQALARWIAEDPEHARAFEDALWALEGLNANAAEPEMLALRSAALMDRGVGMGRRGWGSVAALLAGLLIFMLVQLPSEADRPTRALTRTAERHAPTLPPGIYQTGLGERLEVKLADGSVATLDTNTKLRVAYTKAERAVYLLRGQALFDVAHRRPMPFRVYAAGERITAIGTIFNVRLDGDFVRVAMIEGRVTVRSRVSASRATEKLPAEQVLTTGEALSTVPEAAVVSSPPNIQQVASWKNGVLIFEDTPLSDAVAEINRYTSQPIAIGDGAVGRYRISGLFRSSDPERFAAAASEIFPIEVGRGRDGGPILRSRTE